MESIIRLSEDLFKRLEFISDKREVDVNTLVFQYINNALDDDEETLKFEQETREALNEVKSRSPRRLSKDEFFKELKS